MAALYGAQAAGITALEALEDLRRVLPGANPNPLFLRLLKEAKSTSALRVDEATTAGAQ